MYAPLPNVWLHLPRSSELFNACLGKSDRHGIAKSDDNAALIGYSLPASGRRSGPIQQHHQRVGKKGPGDNNVSKNRQAVIQEDTVIKGEISNCEYIEVFGYVEGEVDASRVLVREGGKLFGTLRAGDAEIEGLLQGDVFVRRLIKVGSTGNVNGDVQYGQIAVDLGGQLSAKLSNVPPEIKGDLELSVKKGRAVKITLVDLNAVDPDDKATDLKFSVSNAHGGFVAHSKSPTKPITNFTQADLEAGAVAFVHDGDSTDKAGFDVQVQDAKGASSGQPHSVNVQVQA